MIHPSRPSGNQRLSDTADIFQRAPNVTDDKRSRNADDQFTLKIDTPHVAVFFVCALLKVGWRLEQGGNLQMRSINVTEAMSGDMHKHLIPF